jgi:hypothetical protein
VCVIHKQPEAKSVEHPGNNLHSEIHTTNVEISNVPIGKTDPFLTNLICNLWKIRGPNIHWPPDLFPEIIIFSHADDVFHTTSTYSQVTCQHLYHKFVYER